MKTNIISNQTLFLIAPGVKTMVLINSTAFLLGEPFDTVGY